ncbi:MAG: tRNA 4-thiouridine(8) synthase ThiI [Clostridiales bacterium]|nr:tRNA 4-thiouridine(8) synthase ThiI [Clostridiales bacterium]
MKEIFLLKQGEMILKGANRRSFELRLESDVKRRVEPFGNFSVRSMQSVLYVLPNDDLCDLNGAFNALRSVFGVVSLSRAAGCDKNLDAVFEAAKSYLDTELTRARSFKVETKRADKRFPMSSIEISQEIGGRLADAYPECAVDVHSPELTVHVEIREEQAFVHGNPARGAGGLPPGSAGRVVSLLSGGIDSPVSTYLAARRGCAIIPVHFASPPYTSELAKKKVFSIAEILSKYCGKMTLELVPLTKIQEEIGKNCPEEFGTIITRRFMMEISDIIARQNGADALITGENLGQVASQTLLSLAATQAVCTRPVLRPLIAFDKREITNWAVEIGTYETSILPYEDCCTVFTPRRPATKPRLDKVIAAESALQRQSLIEEALAGIERVRFG